MKDKKTIKKQNEREREALNLMLRLKPARDVAKFCGVRTRSVYRWATGESEIRPEHRGKLLILLKPYMTIDMIDLRKNKAKELIGLLSNILSNLSEIIGNNEEPLLAV